MLFLLLHCRDFGYVSRNSTTNQHQCHVFRCDIAARGVARALLDNHKHSKAIVSQATPPDSPAARKPGKTISPTAKTRNSHHNTSAFVQSFDALASAYIHVYV